MFIDFFMFHLKLNLFFSLLKAKIEEKVTNTFCILFFRSKTILSIFGEKKNILQTLISNFIFLYCSLIIKKVCANFQKKILIFKVPLIFGKWKLCATEIADFLELNSQKYTWSPVKCKFPNSKKVLNHSTLLCWHFITQYYIFNLALPKCIHNKIRIRLNNKLQYKLYTYISGINKHLHPYWT